MFGDHQIVVFNRDIGHIENQMKSLILFFLLLGPLPFYAQSFDRAAAVQDLDFLIAKIEQYNPALREYHPEFKERATQVIEGTGQDSISIFEFFTQASQICALANEGHFALGTWKDAVHQGILDNSFAFLPIRVKYCAGHLYVWKDYSNEQVFQSGDQILAINGMETAAIMDALLAATPSDGFIKTYAYRQIEAGFPHFYYFYIAQSETFDIRYTPSGSVPQTSSIQALSRSQQGANLQKHAPKRVENPPSKPEGFYGLDFADQHAVLTLPSFDVKRINQFGVKSAKMYKGIFEELQARKTQHLVVDLRNNTGGRNEFADDIVPFIMQGAPEGPHLKKTISWEGKERIYKMPKASKLAFQGKIYVLVNGKTFSAGSTLARYLKEFGAATLIGTETGTRYEGFAGGSTQSVTLPNSQIVIGIPRYLIAYPPGQAQDTRNRGLLPDYSINYSFDDLAAGRDLHLEKALSLIGQAAGQ